MADIELLLTDLSNELGCQPAFNDEGSTTITFPSGTVVVVELNYEDDEQLVMHAVLGDLGVGAYRERVLETAMRANGEAFPRYGDLAFDRAEEKLMLFDMIPMDNLRGDDLKRHLERFSSKANEWTEALSSGNVPQIGGFSNTGPSGMFGL